MSRAANSPFLVGLGAIFDELVWYDFVLSGNGSTASEGEDVQGIMCMLCSGRGDFLQCGHLWLLGIW